MNPIKDDIKSFLEYLEFEKRYSNHTLKSYSTDLEQFQAFLEIHYESLSLEEIKPSIIRSWLAELAEKGISHRSLSRKTACLKSLFKYHKKRGRDFQDPMKTIKSPKFQKKLPEFVQEDKMEDLFNGELFTNDFSGVRDFLVLELLYGTGIRLSELISLKDSSINTGKKILKVQGKGNKQRIVPLNTSLTHGLKSYMQERDEMGFENSEGFLILTDRGKKAYPVFIQRLVKKYLKLITTAEKTSPHLLRHSFATALLSKGADLNAIKDLLGHESLAATQVYTHNSVDKLKKIFKQAHPKA